MRFRRPVVLCLWSAWAAAAADQTTCPSIAGADTHPTFDASQLKEGRFIYRTTLKGEPLGETILEIRHVGSRFQITMNAAEIAQSWKAIVEKSFAPVSASLAMRGKKGAYEMNVRYAGEKITGEERDAGVARPVSAKASGVVIDQRVDWASMMAAKLPPDGPITMRVFDPSTGFSDMLGHVGGTQPLRLDYSICKRGHLEEYTVYATSETPRYMLKEEMPNGLLSELIRIEP
jgi:hypothetical protein